MVRLGATALSLVGGGVREGVIQLFQFSFGDYTKLIFSWQPPHVKAAKCTIIVLHPNASAVQWRERDGEKRQGLFDHVIANMLLQGAIVIYLVTF